MCDLGINVFSSQAKVFEPYQEVFRAFFRLCAGIILGGAKAPYTVPEWKLIWSHRYNMLCPMSLFLGISFLTSLRVWLFIYKIEKIIVLTSCYFEEK